MDIGKRKVSCAVAGLLVVPALVASVSLPFAGEQGAAHAATPAKVTSVKASKVTKSGFKVTWKKASSKKVKGYQLKVYKGKSLKKTYVAKGRSATSKSVSGLSANTKYTVKVRAYTGSSKKKYGKWSTSKSVTTKVAPRTSSTTLDVTKRKVPKLDANSFMSPDGNFMFTIDKIVRNSPSAPLAVGYKVDSIEISYTIRNVSGRYLNDCGFFKVYQGGKRLDCYVTPHDSMLDDVATPNHPFSSRCYVTPKGKDNVVIKSDKYWDGSKWTQFEKVIEV